ncbi:MAG: CDP-alcohol phosphatidyltransferase family protein [Planctomycetes bacterium]|nr:CDP-alcohol phosphatidyltransferase family protein [Planctomycetota bacterium]
MKTASKLIGDFFVWSRDHVARGLVRLGVTPNMLTVFGLLVTFVAAGLIGAGRSYWIAAAAVMMVAGACDMLDGAVARIGGKGSKFGGVLDSACDRISDVALLAGMAYYYVVTWPAQHAAPGDGPGTINLTYALLAVLAVINSTLISYVRARAEDEIANCDVGFWRRGERFAGTVIALFARNLPMLMWELGVWTALTALYRLLHTRTVLALGRSPERKGLWGGIQRVVFFDERRGSLAYDVHTGTAIALLIFARINDTDLLRQLLHGLGNG